jgi:hypothetical protein
VSISHDAHIILLYMPDGAEVFDVGQDAPAERGHTTSSVGCIYAGCLHRSLEVGLRQEDEEWRHGVVHCFLTKHRVEPPHWGNYAFTHGRLCLPRSVNIHTICTCAYTYIYIYTTIYIEYYIYRYIYINI